MKWFIAKCPTGAEEKAVLSLKTTLAKMKCSEIMGQHLVPYQKAGKRTSRATVANYVFIELEMNDDVTQAFNKTDLISLMRNEDLEPIQVPNEEVEKMLAGIKKQQENQAANIFAPGVSVKILEAPFEDFTAVIESVDEKKKMVTASVPILGRQVSVELSFKAIKSID